MPAIAIMVAGGLSLFAALAVQAWRGVDDVPDALLMGCVGVTAGGAIASFFWLIYGG